MEKFEVDLLYKNWNGLQSWKFYKVEIFLSEIWVFHIPHGLIRTHKWLAPNASGFIAQLVRVSHRYHEVTGSNPVEVLTFSGFCKHNCNDHSLLESRNLLHCVMCSSIGVRPWAPVKNFIPSVHQSTGSLLGMML